MLCHLWPFHKPFIVLMASYFSPSLNRVCNIRWWLYYHKTLNLHYFQNFIFPFFLFFLSCGSNRSANLLRITTLVIVRWSVSGLSEIHGYRSDFFATKWWQPHYWHIHTYISMVAATLSHGYLVVTWRLLLYLRPTFCQHIRVKGRNNGDNGGKPPYTNFFIIISSLDDICQVRLYIR